MPSAYEGTDIISSLPKAGISCGECDKFNMGKNVIPQRYLKNNYEHHFKILEFIHENVKAVVT